MKLIKATKERLQKLQPGSVVLSDIDEHVSDFAIFIGYNELTGMVSVVDCLSKVNGNDYVRNFSNYENVVIVDVTKIIED